MSLHMRLEIKSNKAFCDKIAVFNSGEIAEYGTFDELLDKKGLY